MNLEKAALSDAAFVAGVRGKERKNG